MSTELCVRRDFADGDSAHQSNHFFRNRHLCRKIQVRGLFDETVELLRMEELRKFETEFLNSQQFYETVFRIVKNSAHFGLVGMFDGRRVHTRNDGTAMNGLALTEQIRLFLVRRLLLRHPLQRTRILRRRVFNQHLSEQYRHVNYSHWRCHSALSFLCSLTATRLSASNQTLPRSAVQG
jgi:hypothetical protein